MTRRWQYHLHQLAQKLWFRSAAFVVLGVLTAPAARAIQPFVPEDVALELGSEAVGSILAVIASSMLAVTTFSLATTVNAASAVADNTTPRAAKLLTDDQVTQNALSTFVGAFMFSLVGIILLNTGIFDARGRLVLLGATMAVVTVIIVTLLRWIDVLSSIARVDETLDRVEGAVTAALLARRRHPFLGGVAQVPIPEAAEPLMADRIGHVVYVDVEALAAVADAHRATVHLAAVPGVYLVPPRPILWFEAGSDGVRLGDLDEDERERLREAVVLGHRRTFEQDPRFGMVVLGQIASRALSPAVNDPGTAIDVLDAAIRALAAWEGVGIAEPEAARTPPCPRVHVPGVGADDLLEDLVLPIARDGAGNVAVAVRLQKALASLAEVSPRFDAAAREVAVGALERGLAALELASERAYLRRSAVLVARAE